jgi:hypothetical protein
MTDETTVAASTPPESFSDPREAVKWMTSQPEPAAAEPEPNSAAARAEPATAANESADEADTAPLEEATGETDEGAPADEPLRELPRSWSKDKADVWAKLDPAAQDILLEQDKRASAEIRRVQNEAADKLKGLTAREQAAEQARLAHETRAKEALNVLMREQVRDFPDVRSMEDVTRLAQTDPLRYIQWQAHQQELQAQAAVTQEAEQRTTQEKQGKRSAYQVEQDAKLKELIPDFADAKKLSAARDRALPLLTEYGLDLDTLNKWAETDAGFEILQHHGFQRIVADLMKSRDADAARQKASQAPINKQVPPVVRPGSRQPASNSALQSATQAFNLNPTAKNAAALAVAKRQAIRH